jgi:ankyrin repeat protein
MNDLKSLINSGADVNIVNDLGCTPLMMCAKNGNIEHLELLYKNGAYLNVVDRQNHSALYYATKWNNIDAVKYLVKNGAKVTNEIYMTAILKNYKKIISYFDSFDLSKQIMKKR